MALLFKQGLTTQNYETLAPALKSAHVFCTRWIDDTFQRVTNDVPTVTHIY